MVHEDHAPLTESDHRRVLDATRTYREELVVRLAGEVGLRPAEMARLTLEDAREHERDGVVHHLLEVDGKNGRRIAYVPRDCWDAIEKFARERDRRDDEPVLDIGARRIQMLVAEVGDRLEGLEVSSRSLRRSFARRRLDEGVDPRVVRAVGGWSSLDTVVDILEDPEAPSIVRAFANRGRTAGGPLPGGESGSRRFERALDALLTTSAALERAGSRADVEERACDALVEAGYDAAWILGVADGDEGSTIRASAGVVGAPEVMDAGAIRREQREAIEDGTQSVRVGRLADPGIPSGVTAQHLVAEIPIGFGGTSYGTLSVATSSVTAMEERERSVLADMGRRLGQAIAAVTRRRLLRADTVLELEFRTTDTGSFLIETAQECGCSFELEGQAPITERSLVLYVRVRGTSPEAVIDRAKERSGVTRARLIRSSGDDAVIELVMDGESIAATLTEHGGNVTSYVVDSTDGSVTVEFPTDVDVRGVVQGVSAAFPATEFVAKREVSHPVSTDDPLQTRVENELTDKQRSVLRSAYLAGYFDWPRGTTAEELADALGVSSPTLHNHLRKAQRSVLDEVFGDRSN